MLFLDDVSVLVTGNNYRELGGYAVMVTLKYWFNDNGVLQKIKSNIYSSQTKDNRANM